MNTSAIAAWFLGLTVLVHLQNVAFGCQPQLCRRRREVLQNKVRLKLDGCSGKSPAWIRQVAFCLNLRVTTMTLRIKPWYKDAYSMCSKKGCREYLSKRENEHIDKCVKCWEEQIKTSVYLAQSFKITAEKIINCVKDFIHAFLNNDLPQLVMDGYKGSIELQNARPLDYWWSVKVELPCKPKVFVYWNANCINSFAKDLRDGDYYLLVQNKFITKDRITFYVEFSETCTFKPEEINIIWDESTPAPGLVQTSTFPSQFPPSRDEPVSLFYNADNAERLLYISGDVVPEYEIAKKALKNIRLKKRQAENPNLWKIGVLFPCGVSSFKVSDSDTTLLYNITGASDRFLIDSSAMRGGNKALERKYLMHFTLDFGYTKTGCIFDSADITVIPNPPADWFGSKDKQISCLTCVNKQNAYDCRDSGEKKMCAKGEACQTEVRQIAKGFRLITKVCKQKRACVLNSLRKKSAQCRPGKPGSVCRCCCNTNMCNAGNRPCSMRQKNCTSKSFQTRSAIPA